MSHLTKTQFDAIEKSETGYIPPNFEKVCKSAILSCIKELE